MPGIYVGEGKVIHFTQRADPENGKGSCLIISSLLSPTEIPCPTCGEQTRTDGVISSCMDCFLNGGDLYRFEYGVSGMFFLAKVRGGTCTRASSDPPEKVLHRAQFLLENGFGGYDVFKKNCEDFAIYCKTGLLVWGQSGQVASCYAAANAIAWSPIRLMTTSLGFLGGIGGLSLVGCGSYCASRLSYDIGVRKDKIKIPVEKIAEMAREG